MKLLLTRHGQTDWNVQRKIQGITDIELNETGIEQAKIAGERLKGYDIDLVIASPLKRAAKTAQIIVGDREIPIIYDDRIKERCFGNFEGEKIEGTKNEDKFYELWNKKLNKKYEGAESIEELFNRVHSFLGNLKEEYKEKNVLIVTHQGITVPIRAYFEGIPEGMEVLRGLGIGNCEVLEYEL